MPRVYANGSALVISSNGEDNYISRKLIEEGIVQWDGNYLTIKKQAEEHSVEISVPDYATKEFREDLENAIKSLLS